MRIQNVHICNRRVFDSQLGLRLALPVAALLVVVRYRSHNSKIKL